MPITQSDRRAYNLVLVRVTSAELETALWSARYFSTRTLVFNVDSKELRKGPGVWADMEVIIAAGGGAVNWGAISGTLANQTDLQARLVALATADAPTFVFSNDTDTVNTDPVSGAIRFNHGTIGSVTEIALSSAVNGVDKGDLFTNIGGILQGKVVGTTATFEFLITAATYGLWTRYTVTYLKGTKPADGAVVSVRFLPKASTTPSIPAGKMVFVDSVNGNDGTGTRQRQDLPFLTLTAAVTAASSGDTIHVRPGTYTPSGNLAKTGVNWYFAPGAIVNMSAATGAIFSDSGGAIVCSVTGHAAFTRSGSAGAGNNVVRMTNSSSAIDMACDTITNSVATEGSVGDAAAIYHGNGSFTLRCRTVDAVRDCYYWIVGPGFLDVSEQMDSSAHHAVYCIVPDGNTDEVYVRCPKITAFSQAIYTFRNTLGDDGSGFRLWIVAETIGNGRVAIQAGPGKVYITAQKLYCANGTVGEVITFSPEAGDQLFINAQKIGLADSLTTLGADFRLIRTDGTGGLCRIQCLEFDLSKVTTHTTGTGLIAAAGRDMDFELSGGTLIAPAAIAGPLVGQDASTGRRVFRDCVFDNTAGTDHAVEISDDITELLGSTVRGGDRSLSGTGYVICRGAIAEGDITVNIFGDIMRWATAKTNSGEVATANSDGSWSWAAP